MNMLLLDASFPDIWGQLADKGLTLVLLGFAILWMSREKNKVELKVDNQQKKIEALHKEMFENERRDSEKLLVIIQANTSAFNDMSKVAQEILLLIKSKKI
jgi:hypothetical protein